MHTPTVLTIAGFDPYGGAGIQIDTKTIHTLGGYALSVVTATTAQNSQGVSAIEAVSPQMLHLQLTTLLDDMHVDAVKIGMLANSEIIEVVVDIIERYQLKNVVLDTVLASSSGTRLIEERAVKNMVEKLFGLCCLITPNLHETNTILNTNFKGNAKEVPQMAEAFFSLGAKRILLKGGHTTDEDAVDYLVEYSNMTRFSTPRVKTTHTHGTGCLLSSAIATFLAKGEALSCSVKQAKNLLYEKLQDSPYLKLSYRDIEKKRKEPIF